MPFPGTISNRFHLNCITTWPGLPEPEDEMNNASTADATSCTMPAGTAAHHAVACDASLAAHKQCCPHTTCLPHLPAAQLPRHVGMPVCPQQHMQERTASIHTPPRRNQCLPGGAQAKTQSTKQQYQRTCIRCRAQAHWLPAIEAPTASSVTGVSQQQASANNKHSHAAPPTRAMGHCEKNPNQLLLLLLHHHLCHRHNHHCHGNTPA